MIKIDRSKVAAPKVLTDPDSPGKKEHIRAIDYYAKHLDQKKTFPFKIYKSLEVTDALDELFHHKCAYCESKYGATQKVAVEHYRPKGSVLMNGQLNKRGYYWLASDWDNLLASCTDCNSPRKQKVYGANAEVLGKGIEFPIEDEAHRATNPGEETQEHPLLINPCCDDPDNHLVFDVTTDDEVIVRPALKPTGEESPIGKETIRVYGLQRLGLVWARRDRIKLIRAQITRLNKITVRLNKNPGDQSITDEMESEMLILQQLLEDDQPYVGMARQYVARYFKYPG